MASITKNDDQKDETERKEVPNHMFITMKTLKTVKFKPAETGPFVSFFNYKIQMNKF